MDATPKSLACLGFGLLFGAGAVALGAARQDQRLPAAPPLISPELADYVEQELLAGWRSLRSDELPQASLAQGRHDFEQRLLTLPRALGRGLAERATQREAALEDARTGGVFALLERLDAGGVGPLPDLVQDAAAFEAYFAREAAERRADGAARIARDEPAEDGLTLGFPAGVFALEDFLRKWSHPDPLARDLTVTGAGIDRTLLVGGDLSCHSRVRNLRLADCTIYSPQGGLFDLRREAASITLERVRLLGFDTGAGGSSAFNTRALALRLVDCELIGGYGRSPASGRLFDVRTDALMARFDRCRLEGLHVGSGSIRPGATVLFSDCTLRDILDDAAAEAALRPGVAFDGGSFERAPELGPAELDAALRKDLDERFPDWERRLGE